MVLVPRLEEHGWVRTSSLWRTNRLRLWTVTVQEERPLGLTADRKMNG